MKRLFSAIYLFLYVIAAHSFAGSATWSADPVDNNWNNPANWTPATVPNGPTDVATFATSNVTNISLSANTEIGQIIFESGASANSFAVKGSLTVDAPGLTNLSGQTQQFDVKQMTFRGGSSAGSGTIITGNGIGKLITFPDTATAGQATISVSDHASVNFAEFSNAGSAQVTIFLSSSVTIAATAYAGPSASIIVAPGGVPCDVNVYGKNDVPIETGDTGYVYVGDSTNKEPSVGSVAGDGLIVLNQGSTLTVGSNNLSTEYVGVIINDPNNDRCGGLIKVGTGTLTLTAANVHCLGTTINSGVLLLQ